MRIVLALILLAGTLAGCVTAGSTNGPTNNVSENISQVPFVVTVVGGQPCQGINVYVTARGPDGKLIEVLLPIMAKSAWVAWPMVATFEPGEYHISGIICSWGEKSNSLYEWSWSYLTIGDFDVMRFSPVYNQIFVSFTVPPRKLVNIGHLIVHLGPDLRVTRMEVADLPPEADAALKAKYPAAYANAAKQFLRLGPDAVGFQAKLGRKTISTYTYMAPVRR